MALPTPTVLGFAAGYIPTGTTRYIDCPTVADLSAPTSAEISAGSDLSKLISGVNGFNGAGATIDFPNAKSRTVPKIPGLITLNDSNFTLNRDKTYADASASYSDGSDGSAATEGVFVIAETGLGSTADFLQCFRYTVTSVTPSRDLAAGRTDEVMVAISEIGPVVAVPNA